MNIPDRRWMTTAERLSTLDARQAHPGALGDIYYTGGGVYRVNWGARVRGASAARKVIEVQDPIFARRVTRVIEVGV